MKTKTKTELETLQERLGEVTSELARLHQCLQQESAYRKTVEEEIMKLRRNIFGGEHRGQTYQIQIDPYQFYRMPKDDQVRMMRHVLLDGMAQLIDRASGAEYLRELRRQFFRQ